MATASTVKQGFSERQGGCERGLRSFNTDSAGISNTNNKEMPCVYQSRPKQAKNKSFRVSQAQRERILARYEEGLSLRKISREEHLARQTVTRIIRRSEAGAKKPDLRKA